MFFWGDGNISMGFHGLERDIMGYPKLLFSTFSDFDVWNFRSLTFWTFSWMNEDKDVERGKSTGFGDRLKWSCRGEPGTGAFCRYNCQAGPLGPSRVS